MAIFTSCHPHMVECLLSATGIRSRIVNCYILSYFPGIRSRIVNVNYHYVSQIKCHAFVLAGAYVMSYCQSKIVF